MHPFAAGTAGVLNRTANKLSGDLVSLVVDPDLRIDEEGVVASVPRDIDKSDRGSVGEVGCNPSKTVGADPVPPTSLGPPTVRVGQYDQFFVGDIAAPAIGDLRSHAGNACSSAP